MPHVYFTEMLLSSGRKGGREKKREGGRKEGRKGRKIKEVKYPMTHFSKLFGDARQTQSVVFSISSFLPPKSLQFSFGRSMLMPTGLIY